MNNLLSSNANITIDCFQSHVTIRTGKMTINLNNECLDQSAPTVKPLREAIDGDCGFSCYSKTNFIMRQGKQKRCDRNNR